MPSADLTLEEEALVSSKSAGVTSWRPSVRTRLQRLEITSRARWILIGLVLLVYVLATSVSGCRQLWHDELYTYYIAKAATLQQLFSELRLDLNPPLEYLSVRASLAVFGDSAYATRLPSILAFLVGSFCFARFVAKRLDWYFGFLGLLLVWATPFFSYATEARPYGLVFGWFGVAMLAWDSARRPRRSNLSVLCFAVSITGMMLSHIFSLVFIAPFCLAETWRLYRTRKIDWPLWLALLVPASIPLAFVKLMARFETSLFPAMFEASPRKLGAFYFHTLGPEAPAVAVAIAVALFFGIRQKKDRANRAILNQDEIAFLCGLLAIPAIVIALLMQTHGAFFPRYGILTSFGYALVVVLVVARFTDRSYLAALSACCVLFCYDAGSIISAYRVHLLANAWPKKEAALEQVRPDLPLVAASGLTYLELSQYAAPAIVQRLYYLTGRDLAIKYAHATMFQDFQTLKRYFPMRGTIEPYRSFVSAHRQFLVFGTPEWPEDWLLRCLYDVHATVRPDGYFPGPYKDFQLFEVTMPSDGVDQDSRR